jgi:oxygen-dependent protoporphyrinogen oxidase
VASSSAKSIAVLGAGITGLTTAYRLTQRGHRVRLFEISGRTGGAIRSELQEGWLIESGPNSILAGDSSLAALIDELGLSSEVVTANQAARNRYIVRRGVPIAAPLSPPALLTSPLFSLGAKARLISEMLARPRVRLGDVSLEEFIGSHFGQEVVDYALNPFVTGVYAGNPRKLSARFAFPKLWEMEQQHGSLIRGQVAVARIRRERGNAGIISFRRGLQTLTDCLAAKLPPPTIVLNARVEALVPGTPWNVVWHDGATTLTKTFDGIIATVPAPALAQLRFGPLGERPLASLDAIEHPPVSSLFLGYRREQVKHPLDGFGVLVPQVERRSVLGVLFSSSLFPGRAPAGHVALTVLVGGTRDPDIARLPTDNLLRAVEPDLQHLLGVAGPPQFQHHTFWPRAIPQYNLGYDVHLETMAAAERTYRGLFVGGQARDGISVPSCIAAGNRLAAQIDT